VEVTFINILVDCYLDRNFGDDIMLRILALELKQHKLYIKTNKNELLIPFKDIDNICSFEENNVTHFDAMVRVIGSGFMITSKIGMYYAIKTVMKYKKEHSKCKKLITIGCNVGPFLNKFAEFISRREMNYFGLITTRDNYSCNYIKNHAKKTITSCFPDIVFSIPSEWLTKNDEGCLGISAYRNNSKPHLNYDYYTAMAKIADEYIEKTGKKVLLFAYDIENENDVVAAYTIKTLCKNSEMIEIILHIDNGDNIIKNTARCSDIIAVRFHSAILAMRMGIPFFPIIYSKKLDNALDDLNYTGERVLFSDVKSIDTTRLVNSFIANTNDYKTDRIIFERAKGHINALKAYLEKNI